MRSVVGYISKNHDHTRSSWIVRLVILLLLKIMTAVTSTLAIFLKNYILLQVMPTQNLPFLFDHTPKSLLSCLLVWAIIYQEN